MADYIVKDTELTSVANAIRTAGGTNSLLNFPNGFVSAVGNIGSGGSSDLSTATMTIARGTYATTHLVIFPTIVDIGGGMEACVANQVVYAGDFPIILYKQNCGVTVQANSYQVTGSATDLGDGMVLATGDFTVTITS